MMTPSPGESTAGRSRQMAAVFVTLAMVCLHAFFWIHAGGFWRDEVNVINLAGAPSLKVMTEDSFPVLLPLLIKGWSALGLDGSDFSLRLLGVLAGLGLVAALWLAAWIARRSAPFLGLVLLGMNGTLIFWGDSLRAFGLGAALIVLTLAATCAVLEKPTWKRAAILSVVAILSVQELYQNAVFFAAIGLGGWLVCWLRKDKVAAVKIFVAALASVISLLPYLASISEWQHATTIRPGFSSRAALDNLNTILAFPLPQSAWLWGLLGLAIVGQGVAALFRPLEPNSEPATRFTEKELRVFAATILVLSVGGYVVFLRFAALITSPWYFVPLMAVAAACFDLGISLPALPRMLRTVAWGILIGTVALSVPFAIRDLNCRVTNVDLVGKYLKGKVSAQDYVAVTPWYLGISFNRYYQGPSAWDTLPPMADHTTHRFDLVPASAAEDARVTQPALDHMAQALQTGHRVWVVGWMNIPTPGRRASTVAGQYLVDHSESFEPVDLKIKGQTSDYEDVSLLLAEGWRTNQPAK